MTGHNEADAGGEKGRPGHAGRRRGMEVHDEVSLMGLLPRWRAESQPRRKVIDSPPVLLNMTISRQETSHPLQKNRYRFNHFHGVRLPGSRAGEGDPQRSCSSKT